MKFAILPLWKGYLYSLVERIRIYTLINSNQWRFNLNRDQIILLGRSIKKYVTKGGQRKPRAHVYNELIDNINMAMGIATKDELELVVKLNVVKLLNVEDLIMEIKGIKEFAAEVGLDAKEIAGKSDMQIAKMTVDAIDLEKGYSQEFIKWYDTLPDGIFDNMDDVSKSTGDSSIDVEVITQLIEHINGLSKASEFKEVLADAELSVIFKNLDTTKFKLPPQYKKGMIDFLEFLKSSPPESKTSAEKPPVDNTALAQSVSDCKTVDELIAIIESNSTSFEGCDIDSDDLNIIKSGLIKHLGVELELPAQPTSKLAALLKKKTNATASIKSSDLMVPFDPKAFDPNVVFEAASNLQIGQLRKFYTQIVELSPTDMASKPGMKKDSMLDAIATGLVAIAEIGPKTVSTAAPAAAPAAECKVAINAAAIKTAIDTSDKEALIAMCDGADIKLNALQKRSIAQMGKMLTEFIETQTPATVPIVGVESKVS